MSEYLDEIYRNLITLRTVARKMNELGDAAWKMGNTRLSDTLADFSSKIEKAERGINNTVTEELNRTVKQAEEASGNMLRATLAGVELGKKEKGK